MAIGNEELLRQPRVLQPKDASEAVRLKRSLGAAAAYVSGGTLLRTQWENGVAPMPPVLIDVGAVHGLAGIAVSEGALAIGAPTTLSECRRQPLLRERCPALHEAMKAIAAPSVRNLGTIGGNVASGIGDAWPALLALDAELVWHGDGPEVESAASWIARFDAAPETRLLTAIRVPLAGPGGVYEAYRKVGRREAFTPSLVTAALRGRRDADGRWSGCRIAAAGGAMRPMRLAEAEALWEGKRSEELDLALIYQAVLAEYEAAPDAFADAAYRKKTAAGLVAAALWEARGTQC